MSVKTLLITNVSQVEKIYELLEQLTYAQIESLVIVLGEGRFVELGPMDVFGLFFGKYTLKRLKPSFKAQMVITKAFRTLSRRCQEKA